MGDYIMPHCYLLLTGSTQLCPYDGATLTFNGGTVLTCPPTELTCSRNTPILPFDSTSNIPSSCKDLCLYEI